MTRWGLIGLIFLLAGCSLDVPIEDPGSSGSGVEGESARVVTVIDGDTIDVELDGEEFRVRYIGVNTPERDEVCYSEAVRANRLLVDDKTVTLVSDVSDTDQYGRLLRYVYVGELSINERMVEEGWAEVVRYAPDTLYYDHFRELEGKAARAGRGCHPTGVFDDGSVTR
ncbi:MAG: thermonuclease family protein [Anaerolineae bacterium]|nr:thermonuclease family protein [Chloroflexota bacterium]MBP6298677.1 thermonuclease family protein [Anaerolineae bacterium]